MRRPARITAITVLAVLVADPGRADIILNWLDTPIDVSTDTTSVNYPLDLTGNGIVDFTFAASVSFVGVRSENSVRLLVREPPPPNLPGPVVPLELGFDIGPESQEGDLIWFAGHSEGPGTPGYETDFRTLGIWLSTGSSGEFRGQHAYMGIEFDIDGATHYGWINLRVGELGPGVEIYGWAYESTPNAPILAGAIPEPSTLLLLFAGGLGLLLAKSRSRNIR